MELGTALTQISEIHGYLSRSEIYRGYRPRTMALTGGLALGATAGQILALPHLSPHAFVVYWCTMALANLGLVGGEMAFDYVWTYAPNQKRMARKVLAQFAPALAGGALLAGLLTPSSVHLLPGLWSMAFALGIFAARPYLPRGIGWVGLFYLLAGAGLLTETGCTLGSLGMGAAFGLGQLGMAQVLCWNLERRDNV